VRRSPVSYSADPAGTAVMEQVGLPAQIRSAIIAHAEFCMPEEACGLLAVDKTGRLRMVYAMTNIERSSVRFTVAPGEHYGAIGNAERRGWVIGGSFHSHPQSTAFPSARDIAGALDPSWLYLVLGMTGDYPDLRGFRIREMKVDEVALREIP
jgi:[CysO sulfur-carrier protein]-S-L-cysteine hydrolase